MQNRVSAIKNLRSRAGQLKRIGVVFGTLGQQSSLATLEKITHFCSKCGIQTRIQALQEIFPSNIAFTNCDAIVQLSCPRLLVDHGAEFNNVYTTYEFYRALGEGDVEDYELTQFSGLDNRPEIYGDFQENE